MYDPSTTYVVSYQFTFWYSYINVSMQRRLIPGIKVTTLLLKYQHYCGKSHTFLTSTADEYLMGFNKLLYMMG